MKHFRATVLVLVLAAVSPLAAAADESTTAGGDPAPKADPAKAQPIVNSLCVACHGTDGNSPLPVNPSLAGQHARYLYKQLSDYKAGRRKNAVMAAIVATLSDDDMRNLAAYFAAQKPRPGAAKDRELVAAGQKLYRGGDSAIGVPACSSCHSPNGAGIPAQYPRLAGQQGEYTISQLQHFRSGERDNDANAMMRTITARLSDKEIAALAEYISGLR